MSNPHAARQGCPCPSCCEYRKAEAMADPAEWVFHENVVYTAILDLYESNMRLLDLIDETDRNLRELITIVGKLVDRMEAA